ncbi:MAG: hypothetical protein H7Z10_12550, partial [Gemmatimonadaceae bacterium]|nr:hypothetical protein [Acetobacteraceae bacterium]
VEWLSWLASSAAPVPLRPEWHGPLRLMHVGGMAVFFGAIVLLDLRLLGLAGRDVALPAFARTVLPVTHLGFGVVATSGALLFLYDPVHTGGHSWFLPKLLLVAAALANAVVFSVPRRIGLRAIGSGPLNLHARAAGALSLLLWAGVIGSAVANHEERRSPRHVSGHHPAPTGS